MSNLKESAMFWKPVVNKRKSLSDVTKIKKWRPMCDHKGCHNHKVDQYTYPVVDDGSSVQVYFCFTHASRDGGFCPICGWFMAGGYDDWTLYRHGVCSECLDQIRDELGENDDLDDWGDYRYDAYDDDVDFDYDTEAESGDWQD